MIKRLICVVCVCLTLTIGGCKMKNGSINTNDETIEENEMSEEMIMSEERRTEIYSELEQLPQDLRDILISSNIFDTAPDAKHDFSQIKLTDNARKKVEGYNSPVFCVQLGDNYYMYYRYDIYPLYIAIYMGDVEEAILSVYKYEFSETQKMLLELDKNVNVDTLSP